MVIFGTGVMTGGLLVRYSEPNRPSPGPRAGGQSRLPAPPSPGGMRVEFLRRAERELDLKPEQREKIDKLLKESQERTRKIMEPVADDLREEIQATKEEFHALLTPPQQVRFDEMIKQQQRPKEKVKPSSRPQPETNAAPLADRL